jgi:hypothetical protein
MRRLDRPSSRRNHLFTGSSPLFRRIGVDSTEMFATLVLRASCHGQAFARAAR